ncbi:hypothetical protein [Megasphaera massiliensis]|nr:hypothetical protein [uncultured Megasphaera sp.]DAL49083.1 MAG TPA_asm: hypothetical protein [Caudoviricetes sp.]
MTMQETVEKTMLMYGGMDPRDAGLLLPEEIEELEREEAETE